VSPSPLQRLRSPTWRYALTAGLASIPVTLALNWQDPSGPWDASAVALAALVAGYLAKRRGLKASTVGFRTGVVGAAPVLWSVADVVPFVLGLAQPAWFTAVQLVVLTLVVPLLVGLVAVVGTLAGMAGGWLAQRRGHPRRPAGS
jgi:hypothetical protein